MDRIFENCYKNKKLLVVKRTACKILVYQIILHIVVYGATNLNPLP